MSSTDRQTLVHGLLRQGFSPEEAELALLDAGLAPPAPSAAGYPGGHVGPYGPPVNPPYGPPGGPSYGRAVTQATGRTPYLLGLLAWLPVPIVSAVVAGLAMVLAYPRQRRLSPLAAENARAAANWGATYALGTLVSFALTVATGLLLTQGDPDGEGPAWPVAFAVPILVLGVMHLVIIIRGLRRTDRGEVYRPVAVPFFGGPRP